VVSGAAQAAPAAVVAGVPARLSVEPASLAEAAEAVRALAADRLAVAFVGGGTALGLGTAPARLDAVLRTTRLAAVQEHAPADQIVHVDAGLTLAALQRHLAAHRQRLALDPPLPERATIGGLLAANGFGPRRARYGTLRDLVIGVTVIRADGTVAHGGGKVVKNVAGFDLPRLFCGSLGTLGLIAEVILRLHPLPEASETVVLAGVAAAETRALARAAADAFLEPTAVAALPDGDRFRVAFRFEGFGPGVADQAGRLAALAAAQGGRAERLGGGDEAALWAAHDALRTTGDVTLKAAFAPAAIGTAVEALRPAIAALRGGALVLYPTLGIAFATGALEDGAAAPEVARGVEDARRALGGSGGSVVVAAAPPALRARVDVWGAAPGALEVMRRLKAELDPEGRLAPGRMPGGI
jgi:glycolate oxidase FAD binding subunit